MMIHNGRGASSRKNDIERERGEEIKTLKRWISMIGSSRAASGGFSLSHDLIGTSRHQRHYSAAAVEVSAA